MSDNPLTEVEVTNDTGAALPVSVSSLPLPTGGSTSTLQTTGNSSLSSIDTKLSSQATAANQTSQQTLTGAVTETAPASDTASSGLNGRLQRIAQRITSLIALFPTSLGQKTMANSLAVVVASDQALSLSPNQNVSSTGTIAANGASATLSSNGLSSASVVLSGTWVGTIQIQISADGTTFVSALTGTGAAGAYVNTGITTNGTYRVFRVAPNASIRVISTAWTSGTASITIEGSSGQSLVEPVQLNAANNLTTSYGQYNSTLPSVTDGALAAKQLNQFGELAIVSRNKFRNITGAGTTVVKSGSGRFHSIIINSGITATYTIYDNTAGSGTKIATITNSTTTNSTFTLFDVEFSTGLTVVTTGAGTDITMVYQ